MKQETGDDSLFRYGNFDYQRALALIGISHGRGAPWLRRQWIDGGPDDRFFQPVATGESANLAFPGLLLRLADVMDFDASRAPRILFKPLRGERIMGDRSAHEKRFAMWPRVPNGIRPRRFGIENDQSVLEWNKHLSIVGWRLDVDPDGKQQPDLLYSAECQHPVHEKAIREFKTWIDAELSAVRIELDAQRRQFPYQWHGHPGRDSDTNHGQDARATHRYELHLPSKVRLDIRPASKSQIKNLKSPMSWLKMKQKGKAVLSLVIGAWSLGFHGAAVQWA